MQSPVYPEVNMIKKVVERNGTKIEIEYCPKSGGVWLDRGELEKIIAAVESEISQQDMAPNISSSYSDRRDNEYRNGGQDYHHKPHRKRESFLSEIFDF